ncbi:alpha/beta fold hydrolase [Aestuariivirga sp. YIM B02566]|uniref:Alpha/beta hydrolase n=1 Tax=Taklimakanibacter albus TaxID=2800327 RepID=A0ACC5R9V3_9HYPH|nr:alpha/beta hydrolase [Aestuariivirga sp. YIM B02566]MBK1869444.1 alpha/beta hydrolase [Aestuariivirga sp. YIM B02566]
MSDLFPNTREHRVETGGAEIFARIGGEGPPLLLLHGYPQTHAMWHAVAPALMAHHTCVMPDLRGYGFSSCPANTQDNRPYSKRVMAEDMRVLMRGLGHERFAVVGHDRGARVGYRMALDHRSTVTRLALIDIMSTWDMWHGFSVALAMKTYHWLFLAQPHPLPEMLIEPAPIGFLDYTMARWTKAKDLSAFAPAALAEYRLHFATPEHIHATCNDYRAGQSIDLADDEADLTAGHKIACPLLVLWGDSGIPGDAGDPSASWRRWANQVKTGIVAGGHFLAEENPQATLAHLLPFLARKR